VTTEQSQTPSPAQTRWDQASAEIREAASRFAGDYPNVWVPQDQFGAELIAALRPTAARLARWAHRPGPNENGLFVTAWIIAGPGVLLFLCGCVLSTSPAGLNGIGGASLFFGLLLIVLAVIFWVASSNSKSKTLVKETDELLQVGWNVGWEVMAYRSAAAMVHKPRGPAPGPQPYGVSHDGAERLVAEWMRHLGEMDAEVTRFTGDGGIDVMSTHCIAQVKNYTGTVGVTEIRELAGVAAVDGRRPLFFTSGTYASGAIEFAERAGIALFRYDAVAGTLLPVDAIAARAIQQGL